MTVNKGGRPPEITKEWADSVAESLPDMFANGESVAEVCVDLDICKASFYKATKISPKFINAYKKGLDKSEAWWTKLGRAGAAGKVTIQPTTWIFNMKNRFDWADMSRTQHSITNNIMPMPSATSVDDWEAEAKKQQEED